MYTILCQMTTPPQYKPLLVWIASDIVSGPPNMESGRVGLELHSCPRFFPLMIVSKN